MVHFKAIADDLGIKVTKLRKGSPYLGDLKDDCMVIGLSIMTEKDYGFTLEFINKIAKETDKFRTDLSVCIDFINNYNEDPLNKYVFIPLKENGICYNMILRNKDKDLMIINNTHVFCYVNGKIVETDSNYLATDVSGCKISNFVFERIERPKTYKFKKIGYKPKAVDFNSLEDSEFLLKSLNNKVKVLKEPDEEETLFNLPILALSRLTNIPYKEAAMSLVLFDDNHTGICSNLLYSYLSETYETENKSYSGKERNYNLYSFLTSDETEKSKFMVIYVKMIFGSWKDNLFPVAVKDGVIQSTVDCIEILLSSPVTNVQYICTK